MKSWLLPAVAGLLAVVLFFLYKHENSDYNSRLMFVNADAQSETYPVKTIRVISGREFDLLLQDGRRIYVQLGVSTPPEAKERVISYINNSEHPSIIVLEKRDNIWIVDLLFGQSSLTEWLIQQNLVWDNYSGKSTGENSER